MKMKRIFILLTTLLGITFTSLTIDNFSNSGIKKIEGATTTANFGQMYNFMLNKNEHYPISDAFIKEYQQESGGYIDRWKSQGKTVDKSKCEPNQYWHFFESWCKPSIDDGSLKFSAKGSRGYSNFSCPELVLWIMEASGIETSKVSEAYDVAVAGKKAGTKVQTICSNMRNIVPWTDINTLVLAGQPTNPPYHVTPSVDTVNKTPQYTMSKFNYDGYQPNDNVSFTVTVNDSTKEIDSVTGNDVVVSKTNDTYSFTMPSTNVDLTVTLKEKGGGGDTPIVTDGQYKWVTNLDELIDGSKVIIGTPGSFTRKKAISTTQNANNRSAIDMVYGNGYYKVNTESSQTVTLCVFTISRVTYNEKTYYQFYDSTEGNKGYLYVCSSSSNYLRTQSTNNVNGYFEITNNAGIMTIAATASTYQRNILGNYSSTFAAYGGGSSTTTIDLAIYSDVVNTTKVWASSYMKIDDPSFIGEGTGLCKSLGLYDSAKTALLKMGKDYITVLKTSNDITISSACARYEAWAIANNDNAPYGTLSSFDAFLFNNQIDIPSVIILIAICSISLLVTSIILINKRRTQLNKNNY